MALSRYQSAGRVAAIFSLGAVLAATMGASAAWASGPQPSTLTVTPTTVVAGSTANTLTFAYTSGNNVVAGTLRIPINNGFSAPMAANVSTTLGSGCTNATPSISGIAILVQFSCAQNGTFTVTDTGETAPNKVKTVVIGATTTGAPITSEPVITVVAGPAAKLKIQGLPATVDSDVATSATVVAEDALNNVATTYTGTVKFNSSDPRATLPGPYTFTSADLGTHVFTGILMYTAGKQTLVAGDANLPTAATAKTTVVPPQTIVVSPASPTIVRGQSQPFSASVSFPDGTTVNPDGFVSWNSSSPSATISKSGVATGVLAGSSTISATLSGVVGSTSLAITPSPSTTALSSSVNPSVSGQNVTFTASVAPVGAPGTATGTVTFSDGNTTLATAPLSGGTASFSTAALSVGDHDITAAYSGDANNQPSSNSLTQTVSAEATTTAVVSSAPGGSTYGQPVTFTATVTANAPGTSPPVGTVIFTAGNSTLLGFAPVAAEGTASVTVSTLPVGNSTINAYYSPATGSSTASAGSVGQTVNQAAPTVTVTADNTTVTTGKTVNFTVTVTGPGSVGPTGSVDLQATGSGATTDFGSMPLANGQTGFSESFASADTYQVVAFYSGDSNYLAADNSATPLTVTVVPAG
jgi:large repetitive protein